MARYTGPRCKLARREGFDLEYTNGTRPLDSKCNMHNTPGQQLPQRGKKSDYYFQLREKQKVKRLYCLLEKQFRNYYKKASRRKGATGLNLLWFLESRLDNVVYRMGFASTRREARQLVNHKGIEVNGRVINIPSYNVQPGDIIKVHAKAADQQRISLALEIASHQVYPSWINVDEKEKQGTFMSLPERDELTADINENLIVELYSK